MAISSEETKRTEITPEEGDTNLLNKDFKVIATDTYKEQKEKTTKNKLINQETIYEQNDDNGRKTEIIKKKHIQIWR